jgi:hypothetical protein
MAMNGPGPIRKAIQTAKLNKQLRKEEKVRAADRGYNYNRNIVHPNESGSPTMLKGSVKAAIASGMAEKKKDVKAMASNVKGKVTEMKKASEARKAAKANETRGWSNRGDLSGKGSKSRQEIIRIDKKKGGFEQGGSKVQDKYKSNKKGIVAKAIDKMQRNKAIAKGGVPKPKGKKGFIG